jgi:hypothetical protein
MLRIFLLSAILIGVPSIGSAQECSPTKQHIGWSQPNNVPIANDNAIRWPTNSTVRLAYGGQWCPEAEQIEVVDEEGTAIPAQIRLKTPYKLVTNAPDPLTLVEIDPIDELRARTDYTVTIRPPDPALALNREYILEFRTRGGPADEMPDFEGVREARLNDSRCVESGGFFALEDTDPNCPVPNRMYVAVDFQPLNRPDIGYVVYRTRSVPVATLDNPETEPADNTPVPVAFENGARDLLGTGVPLRSSRVFVPYYPLPRRDCFAVMAIDEWGREHGDLENDACVDLLPLAPCPEGCDPAAMMCQTFPDPNPFEAGPPMEGQSCSNVGVNGADPDRPIPPIGNDGGGGGGTLDDGGLPLGDGGVPGSGDGGANGGGESSGGGGCMLGDTAPSTPWPTAAIIVVLGLLATRRRRA